MPKAHAVALIHKIKMGINLDHMDRPLIVKGVDAGDIHRMVATQNDRNRSRSKDFAHAIFNIGMALDRIGMHDIRVADIHDRDLGRVQIGHIILVVIGPRMAERKQGRGLADRAWTHPCT